MREVLDCPKKVEHARHDVEMVAERSLGPLSLDKCHARRSQFILAAIHRWAR